MGSLLERTIGEAKDPDPAESLDSVKKIVCTYLVDRVGSAMPAVTPSANHLPGSWTSSFCEEVPRRLWPTLSEETGAAFVVSQVL